MHSEAIIVPGESRCHHIGRMRRQFGAGLEAVLFNQGGVEMRTLIAVVALALLASPAMAQRKACEELKTEIEAKIKANGVKVFTLEIVGSEDKKEGKVVGTCDGGSKKILYKRGG